MSLWLKIVLCIVVGYLLGNLNGAIVISRTKMKEDIREKGSGNAGMTNFMRNYGGFGTVLVILVDIGKVMGACLLATLIWPEDKTLAKTIAGIAAQIGHIFPILFGFRGGKGVMCTGALAIMLDLRMAGIAFALFLIVFFATRLMSLASIVGLVSVSVLCCFFFKGQPWVWGLMLAMAVLSIFMHRKNILRLIHGTESKTYAHKNEPKN